MELKANGHATEAAGPRQFAQNTIADRYPLFLKSRLTPAEFDLLIAWMLRTATLMEHVELSTARSAEEEQLYSKLKPLRDEWLDTDKNI